VKDINIFYLILSFLVSFSFSFLFSYLHKYTEIGIDLSTGIQKFHSKPTSRLGGIGLFFGVLSFFIFNGYSNSFSVYFPAILFLSSIPVFLGGLIEDLTHSVSPRIRLFLAFFSANLFCFLTNSGVERTDITAIDWLLHWQAIAYLTTLLVIAGFTHSINIIDGFNGLASSQIFLMLSFLSLISFNLKENELLLYCLLLFVANLAFFSLNWPYGKIFLGDGGAYFLGINVVFIGLSLVHKHKDLSPFFPIMLGLYPLVEILFSIYRRVLVKGKSMNEPDALHLHSLIYRRIILKYNSKFISSTTIRNSFVCIYFFFTSLFFDSLSFFFQNKTQILIIFFCSFIFLYLWSFKKIVTFKSKSITF